MPSINSRSRLGDLCPKRKHKYNHWQNEYVIFLKKFVKILYFLKLRFMQKELSSEIVTAIELLHNLPSSEEENYRFAIRDISERVAHVWWEIKGFRGKPLEEELDAILSHPRIYSPNGQDQAKLIEIHKRGLSECILAWNAMNFGNTLLHLFWVKGWENVFLPRIFHPEIDQNTAIFKVRNLTRSKVQQILPWLYQEDWEKVTKIDDTITQWLQILKQRLYLLRLPIFDALEDAHRRMNISYEYRNLESILELIRTTALLTRKLSSITNPDVLEALDEEHRRIQKAIENIETLEPPETLTLADLRDWIEESYGIKLTLKNPSRIIDPRRWRKTTERYLLKAAYTSHPDLIKLSRLQTSIKKIRKSLQEKKPLSDEQKLLVEEISEHYSQKVIRHTFDYAFYQLATRFKKSR